jgi:hypothetical protein
MTLVAGLSVGGMPAFLGDLLLSRRLPDAVELPTQLGEKVIPGFGGDHAHSLAQKIIIVRPYLLVAWAGRRSEVDRLIREIDVILPAGNEAPETADDILSILDTCAERTELVALLIWNNAVHPFLIRTRGFELDDRRLYLLGSGTQEFFEYIQTHPDLLPNQERADGQVARAILLRFAARAMLSQWKAGTGLSQSWGGGFEIAYPEVDGFKKVDNILYRAWLIDEGGNYDSSGRSFFIRYYGKDLHLSRFSADEKTYIIPSPLHQEIELPAAEEVHPEWTVDVFLMKETASFVEFARFQPPHHPTKDRFHMSHGRLVGWEMDKTYVEECVTKAIAAQGRNQFSLSRY